MARRATPTTTLPRRIQHRIDTHLQTAAQKGRHAAAHSSGGTGAGQIQDLYVQIGPHHLRQMMQSPVQPLHRRAVRPFLGAKHRRGTVGAAQGIVDITHGDDLHTRQSRGKAGFVDVGDALQGAAHRDEGLPRFV